MRPSADEEAALRAYLGEDRYQRFHEMAQEHASSGGKRRGTRNVRGNVVVIHGIMGGELTATGPQGGNRHIWAKPLRILAGDLARLRLDADGVADHEAGSNILATGIMKKFYGDLLFTLSREWNVRAFWFDWRKDLETAAHSLNAEIAQWIGDAPAHIVAHSMGGLVARTMIMNHAERWKVMRGRLIMLGTPNHGSFAIPQVITGRDQMVRLLALADLHHNSRELQDIFNTFVGSYQMLPSPRVMPRLEKLYDSKTYGSLNVPQRHLDRARKHHDLLWDVVEPERMVYIAGYNHPTFSDISDWNRLGDDSGYAVTRRGDGRVPHRLGLLEHETRGKVPTYYVEEGHGPLTESQEILGALRELLETGETATLATTLPASVRGRESEEDRARARAEILVQEQADEALVARLKERLGAQRGAAGEAGTISEDERRLEEALLESFLGRGVTGTEGTSSLRPLTGGMDQAPALPPQPPVPIEIALVRGSIGEAHELGTDGPPVDALAVGHYIGVKCVGAELALDKEISKALPGTKLMDNGDVPEACLIITQYTQRGIFKGELGEPFLLQDPRAPADRVIAVGGMGRPGRFGEPELTVLARELCWSLGRLGKRHLATVLIGAGNGNIQEREAIKGWLRGIAQALGSTVEDDGTRLQRVTFVEYDPRKIVTLQNAILAEAERMKNHLAISYTPIDDGTLDAYREEGLDYSRQELEEAYNKERERSDRARAGGPAFDPAEEIREEPTRLTLELDRDTYRFGAITASASVPERAIPLDPALVTEANDELAAASVLDKQFEQGRFLEQLLLPGDLRAHLTGNAPLVLMLDSTTARVHWEMLAQPDPFRSRADGGDTERPEDTQRRFLGTSRGLTRQLRTTFAPPPEPPPPPRRVLRVLVVADPAEDAPLPGAEAEGREVARLFNEFNTVYGDEKGSRVEVTTLFGPREGKRTNVLRELMNRSYDVLHFAGHCVYDPEEPAASGWIFTGGKRLSAKELNRIDRIPKFVFSNACESGITPDRSDKRAAELAPSFAEAFFARGVANFVCTAWPVDDEAAVTFARRLYEGLLGLDTKDRFEPMHLAMQQARLAIVAAGAPGGARTWGAYQHYGNPHFRFFFDPSQVPGTR